MIWKRRIGWITLLGVLAFVIVSIVLTQQETSDEALTNYLAQRDYTSYEYYSLADQTASFFTNKDETLLGIVSMRSSNMFTEANSSVDVSKPVNVIRFQSEDADLIGVRLNETPEDVTHLHVSGDGVDETFELDSNDRGTTLLDLTHVEGEALRIEALDAAQHVLYDSML